VLADLLRPCGPTQLYGKQSIKQQLTYQFIEGNAARMRHRMDLFPPPFLPLLTRSANNPCCHAIVDRTHQSGERKNKEPHTPRREVHLSITQHAKATTRSLRTLGFPVATLGLAVAFSLAFASDGIAAHLVLELDNDLVAVAFPRHLERDLALRMGLGVSLRHKPILVRSNRQVDQSATRWHRFPHRLRRALLPIILAII
jgi:hypothetical protein